MKSDFFNEFRSVSSKEWKQKIQFELEGENYIQKHILSSVEGINTQPFYTYEDTKKIEVHHQEKKFRINTSIFIAKESTANQVALKTIKEGSETITFEAQREFNVQEVLSEIPSNIQIQFKLSFFSEKFYNKLINDSKHYKVFFNIDIIGNLAKSGNWYKNSLEDFESLNRILKKTNSKQIGLLVDSSIYQNAGANIVQQISYALAHYNEYLNRVPDNFLNEIQVKFAIGSNHYFEIAKVRAFKYLFNLITKNHGLSTSIEVFCEPTSRNKTIYNHELNELKTFSECLTASLANADCISNFAPDYLYKKKSLTKEQNTLNQLLTIQKDEELKGLSEGSYLIESLTTVIAKKSLELFKSIEKGGGFIEQLTNGTIQRKIKENQIQEQQIFNGKEIPIFQAEKINDQIEIYPFLKYNKRKTIISPILPIRLTEEIEKDRLKNEA